MVSCTSPEYRLPTQNPDNRTVRQLVEFNLAEYWASFGAGNRGEVHDSDSSRWIYSGTPYFNRVVSTHFNEGNADAQIRETVRVFRRRRAAFTWLTGPSSTPIDLGERLERHAFDRYSPWSGMALHLGDVSEAPPPRLRIDLRPVDDADSYTDWLRVVCKSYRLPRKAWRKMYENFTFDHQQTDSDWFHNLAVFNGVPVGASTVFLNNGVAGIYLVATVPEARGNGIGTAMTNTALQQIGYRGYKLAVLHATEQSRGIYEKLGFRHYCDIGVYRMPVPNPLWSRLARAGVRKIRSKKRSNQRRGTVPVTNKFSNGVARSGKDIAQR
jgi:GNAT superfamily N-acetyltransferase